MDRNAYNQIALPSAAKVDLIHEIMRYSVGQDGNIPRTKETNSTIIAWSTSPTLAILRENDPWVLEHCARLFWICISMGLFTYQYPYPHVGQSYRPTRLGRIFAWAPRWGAHAYMRAAIVADVITGPLRRFAAVRNTFASVAVIGAWLINSNVTAAATVVYAVVAGCIGAWLAAFFSD